MQSTALGAGNTAVKNETKIPSLTDCKPMERKQIIKYISKTYSLTEAIIAMEKNVAEKEIRGSWD